MQNCSQVLYNKRFYKSGAKVATNLALQLRLYQVTSYVVKNFQMLMNCENVHGAE